MMHNFCEFYVKKNNSQEFITLSLKYLKTESLADILSDIQTIYNGDCFGMKIFIDGEPKNFINGKVSSGVSI